MAMTSLTLFFSGATVLAIAALFATVGFVILKRNASPETRVPLTAFALWWFGYAAYTMEAGTRTLLSAFGVDDVALHISLIYIGLFLLCVGLVGLMVYLIYVYTGSRQIIVPLGAFYASFYMLALYAYGSRNPVDVAASAWTTWVVFEHPENPHLTAIILVSLLVPLGIGAVLYSLLYFKVKSGLQKKRILLVGGAFLAWFILRALGDVTSVGDSMIWAPAIRIVALLSALVVLYAFLGLKEDPPRARDPFQRPGPV